MQYFVLVIFIVLVSACTNKSEDEPTPQKTSQNATPVITAGATLTFTQTPVSYTAHYTDWTAADPANGTAEGIINIGDNTSVSVNFKSINQDGTDGKFYFAQTTPSTNYWIPSAPYISNEVTNAPPDSDLIALQGGLNQTYVVTFSEPIKDPIMSIVSLGAPAVNVTYIFDTPFDILSQGAGYWGGGPDALAKLDGNILSGYEGHGTIRFIGTFPSFTWTVPTTESWHGFTFAIRTTESNEPSIIDAQLTITDADDSELTGAVVTISDGFTTGDILAFTNQNGIIGTYDDVTGELTLSGQASLLNYQTALRSVSYNTTSSDPTVGGSVTSRTISWSVTDADAKGLGAKTSIAATSTINITAP